MRIVNTHYHLNDLSFRDRTDKNLVPKSFLFDSVAIECFIRQFDMDANLRDPNTIENDCASNEIYKNNRFFFNIKGFMDRVAFYLGPDLIFLFVLILVLVILSIVYGNKKFTPVKKSVIVPLIVFGGLLIFGIITKIERSFLRVEMINSKRSGILSCVCRGTGFLSC